MSAASTIPADYNAVFIQLEARVTNHFGSQRKNAKEQEIVYPVEFYDAVQNVIANYDSLYLTKRMIPATVARIADLRREKMQRVNIGGIEIKLDTPTEAHLCSAVIGLTRNPDVAAIDWELSPGVFATIPREAVLALGDGAFMHVQNCFTFARNLTDRAQACTTSAELEALDITTGWPNE
jgi:hypothetical protein